MTETKQVILDHANITLSDEYFEELVAQHAAKRQSDEAAEGLKSFAEKRNPSWYTGTA
jgi:methylglutaconyl-CoA hydratase